MNNHRIALIGAAAFLTLGSAGRADSLFPGSSTFVPNSAAVSIFSDSKARRVGDILTVVINENASASSASTTQTSKTENGSYGPGSGVLGFVPSFGLSGSMGSNASGATTRADNLIADIAVTVTQVLPNGNLMVEGKRSVGMNSETQLMTLTGVVRQEDIASDNTIQSPLVADAQIVVSGKGTASDLQHEGLITRLFKLLF